MKLSLLEIWPQSYKSFVMKKANCEKNESQTNRSFVESFRELLLLHHILGLIEETCCLIIRFRDTVASIGEMWEAAEKYMDGTYYLHSLNATPHTK